MKTNSNLLQLRRAAREIFDEALRAVDAGDAIRRAVRLEGSRLTICDTIIDLATGAQKVYSIAIGKAAPAMAAALDEIIGERITAGVITSNFAGTSTRTTDRAERATRPLPRAVLTPLTGPSSRWRGFAGGHPEPNQQSLAAAHACFELLERANEDRALVVFLASGGGSAMLEWPIDVSITLADLRAANRTLVACGASISEINAVRRAFSAVKGGRLAALAPNCKQITLIVSDVPAGDEANVASGPTLSPPSDAPTTSEVISKYDLAERLPASILRAVAQPSERPFANETARSDSKERPLRKHSVLLDNRSVLEAAAKAAVLRSFTTEIARDISDQPIDEGCALLLSRTFELRDARASRLAEVRTSDMSRAACLISGGEFLCPVRRSGVGGRNAETVLRLAIEMTRLHEQQGRRPAVPHPVALSAGTDGIDGNSPAAGAIADETTIARARARGLNEQEHLAGSDAYTLFDALGDLIVTGPTGTNVGDLRILLVK